MKYGCLLAFCIIITTGCVGREISRALHMRIYKGGNCIEDRIVDVARDKVVGGYGLEYAIRGDYKEILVQVDRDGKRLFSRTVSQAGDSFVGMDIGDIVIVIERL